MSENKKKTGPMEEQFGQLGAKGGEVLGASLGAEFGPVGSKVGGIIGKRLGEKGASTIGAGADDMLGSIKKDSAEPKDHQVDGPLNKLSSQLGDMGKGPADLPIAPSNTSSAMKFTPATPKPTPGQGVSKNKEEEQAQEQEKEKKTSFKM